MHFLSSFLEIWTKHRENEIINTRVMYWFLDILISTIPLIPLPPEVLVNLLFEWQDVPGVMCVFLPLSWI